MSNNLKELANNRKDLLLAEVGALLHDMGKCDERFVEMQAGIENGYDYETEHSHLIDESWKLSLLQEEVCLKELIEQGMPKNIDKEDKKWLVRVLGFCHSAAHTVKEKVFYLRSQSAGRTRRGNSFGYEPERLEGLRVRLEGLPFGQLSDRSLMRQKIEEAFSHACGDTQRPINDVSLWDWSNMVAALYKAAIAEAILVGKKEPSQIQWRLFSIRFGGVDFLTKTTRIPDLLARRQLINDGLNRVRTLLEEKYPLGTEVYRDENGSAFIVPNLDICKLEDEDGVRLSSLVQEAFGEGTLGNDGSLKLHGEVWPTLEVDKEGWQWENPYETNKSSQQIMDRHNQPLPIDSHVQEEGKLLSVLANSSIVRDWWRDHREDVCTVCQLRPQGWDAHDREEHYHRQTRGEPCLSKPACQTCKALQRKVCAICERRREERSNEWSGKLSTTIWIDEVSDINGRVALVIGEFGLKTWFNGKSLFYPQKRQNDQEPIYGALRVKNLGDQFNDGQSVQIARKDYLWQEKSALLVTASSLSSPSQFKPPSPVRPNPLNVTDLNIRVNVKDVRLSDDGQYQIVLDNHPSELAASTLHSLSGQKFRVSDDGLYLETMNDMAKKVIEERILHSQSLKIEKHFILPILEPPPAQMVEAQAPTRLFRVWETTKSFWDDAVSKFKKHDTVGEITCRLQIEATFAPKIADGAPLGISHTCELKLGKINLSIACTKRDTYLTVDNLRRAAFLLGASEAEYENDRRAAQYMQGYLDGKTFDVEEPTGYGSSNKALGMLKVTIVKPENTSYVPAVPILKESRTFMALVPADKALQVAKAIKKKYQAEMGKVQNRLPLTLGLVFAGARTPLPAVLDAGRRMLKQPTEATRWLVRGVDLRLYPEKVLLTLEPGGGGEPSLTLNIPAIMGDDETEDVWYPYWSLEEEVANASERKRKFKGIDGKCWTHVSDLQVGDVVSFMPSRFDFEYLDTAARRFEISYDNDKRRGTRQPGGSYHPARPYYLEQLDAFDRLWEILSQGLETTQIHALIGIIEDKREAWNIDQNNETFKQAVRDALNNANWKLRLKPEQFEQLSRAALSGQLADVAELSIRILNPRPEVSKSQTETAKTGVNS